MTIVTGDAGGLIFRTDSAIKTYYRFSLDTDSQGIYHLFVCKNCSNPDSAKPLTNIAMPVKNNQPYIVTIIALKNAINLYDNGQFIVRILDTTAQFGGLGVYAVDLTHPTEVVFSNMKVWTL